MGKSDSDVNYVGGFLLLDLSVARDPSEFFGIVALSRYCRDAGVIQYCRIKKRSWGLFLLLVSFVIYIVDRTYDRGFFDRF